MIEKGDLQNRQFDKNDPTRPVDAPTRLPDPKGSEKVQADIQKMKGVRVDKFETARALEYATERHRLSSTTDVHCQHCAASGFALGRDAVIRTLEVE